MRPNGLELRIMVLALSIILASLFIIHPIHAADPSPCSLPTASQEYIDYVAKYGPCPAGLDQLEQMIGNIISVIVGLGFIAMLVLLIMAGFKYLTSGGEPKALQAAHHTLAWAILGLFLMAVAWMLLQLIQAFTGIEVTVFNIKILCKNVTGGLPFCP